MAANAPYNERVFDGEAQPSGLSRRRLIRLMGLGVTGIAASSLVTAPSAAAHGAIVRRSEIGGAATYYELSGRVSPFGFNPQFYSRLETFLHFWDVNTPTVWGHPLQVWTYGAHVDKGSGAHDNGQGFDLSRIYARSGDKRTEVFSARYDNWSAADRQGRTGRRRLYWATAAGAHYHFRHVLTYPYNAAHHNHIHIDNLRSGSRNSIFVTGSEAQVKHVQACSSYIWGMPTAVDGVWGPQTSRNSRRVLTRIGRFGQLTTQGNWLAFNQATLRYGSGRQKY